MSDPIFIDTSDVGFWGQLFMLLAYGYILFVSANVIGDGSDILMEFYGAGVVGGLVIPILGAVPDGMMILMSGMGGGSKAEIQEELSIGIGTLAGSTIMLLTAPLAIGIWVNRRVANPETGKADKEWQVREITTKDGKSKKKAMLVAKKPTKFSWSDCATALPDAPTKSIIMMAVSLTLLVIQIPATIFNLVNPGGDEAMEESIFALIGMIIAAALFFWYSWYCVATEAGQSAANLKKDFTDYKEWLNSRELMQNMDKMGGSAAAVFRSLDEDNDQGLDEKEMMLGLQKLGYKNITKKQAKWFFNIMDNDGNGRISQDEFEDFVSSYMGNGKQHFLDNNHPGTPNDVAIKRFENFWNDREARDLRLELDKNSRHQMLCWISEHHHSGWISYTTEIELEHASDIKQLCIEKIQKDAEGNDISPLRTNFRVLKYPQFGKWCNSSDWLIYRARTHQGARLTFDYVWDQVFEKKSDEPMSWTEFERACSRIRLGDARPALRRQFVEHSTKFRNSDGSPGKTVITKAGFKELLEDLVVDPKKPTKRPRSSRYPSTGRRTVNSSYQNDDDDDKKEEEEDNSDDDVEEDEGLPEFMENWTAGQQKAYALFLLVMGTIVVSVFSDPMVDVLNDFGHTIGVNPFYVSFIVTPLASNACEVLSGIRAAAKKTNKSMSVCVNALYGAATMNSTFCLSIFLGLVYFRGLSWDYTAEVAAILLVIFSVGIIGLKDTHTVKDALIILLLFPLSIVFIWFLENILMIR